MVNVSLVSFCDEVREGDTKKLDLSVLHAMDLDVPRNILRFTVVKAPNHGSIIKNSSDRQGSKRREASHQSSVVDFTMSDLSNGTFSMSLTGLKWATKMLRSLIIEFRVCHQHLLYATLCPV